MVKRNIKKVLAFIMLLCILTFNYGSSISTMAADDSQLQVSEVQQLHTLSGGSLQQVYFPGKSLGFLAVDGWETKLKAMIIQGLQNYQTEIDISSLAIDYNTQLNTAVQIYRQVLDTNVDLFYVSDELSYSYYSNSIVKAFKVTYRSEFVDQVTGKLNIELVKSNKEIINNSIASALSTVTSTMTDVEKALALHDWIIRYCDYDITNLNNNTVPDRSYAAYGVFRDYIAVCQGYSLAYSYLLQKVGISSYIVASTAMDHAWNLLNIGGNWYHVDTTWDDPVFSNTEFEDKVREGYGKHTYFLLSDSEMLNADHYDWFDFNEGILPAANVSNSFSNYCFRSVNALFEYYNGFWYYGSGNIYKMYIDSSNPVDTFANTGTVYYFNIIGSMMYWTTTSGLYKASIDNPTKIQLLTTQSGIYTGYTISEFTIRNSRLYLNMYKNTSGVFSYQHLQFIPTTGIALNYGSGNLKIGENLQLGITVTPSNTTDVATATWTSSNEAVAKVDSNGLVTGISNGSAVITVNYSGFTQSSNITVTGDLKGDITLDGIVDVFDIVAIQKYLLGVQTLSAGQLISADVTASGEIDIFDIVAIQRTILGIN